MPSLGTSASRTSRTTLGRWAEQVKYQAYMQSMVRGGFLNARVLQRWKNNFAQPGTGGQRRLECMQGYMASDGTDFIIFLHTGPKKSDLKNGKSWKNLYEWRSRRKSFSLVMTGVLRGCGWLMQWKPTSTCWLPS